MMTMIMIYGDDDDDDDDESATMVIKTVDPRLQACSVHKCERMGHRNLLSIWIFQLSHFKAIVEGDAVWHDLLPIACLINLRIFQFKIFWVGKNKQ